MRRAVYICIFAVFFILATPERAVAAEGYLMPDHILLQLGESGSFSVPFGGTKIDMVWQSGDSEVAVVSANGQVRATGPGITTITASANGNTAYGVVLVRDYAPSLVRALALDRTRLQLQLGENARLTASIAPTHARNHTVYFISTDSSIAAVDNGGRVTGHSNGTATVYAYSADWSSWAGCSVTVGSNTGGNYDDTGQSDGAGNTSDDNTNQSGDGQTAQPGWNNINGIWQYYINGYPATGWQLLNGRYYYFDPAQGNAMQSGWQSIGGHWYYLSPAGTDDGTSAMQTGWLDVDGKLYYLAEQRQDGNPAGSMLSGVHDIGGYTYRFRTGGSAVLGWSREDGVWRYYYPAVVEQRGPGGQGTVVWPKGSMAKGWMTEHDAWYYFDSNGVMQTGWLHYEGEWYYLREDGVMQVGWTKLDEIANAVTGDVRHRWYLFRTNGSMYTGWYYDWQDWYYLHERSGNGNLKGSMAVGWVTVGGNVYYMHPGGRMATRWNVIDNERYYFRYSGIMVTGWMYDGAEWYCFGDNGKFLYKTGTPE